MGKYKHIRLSIQYTNAGCKVDICNQFLKDTNFNQGRRERNTTEKGKISFYLNEISPFKFSYVFL